MRTLGLPDVVGSPTAVLAPRIVQVESIEPSVGLHGIRDTLLFNMYWRETTPISTNLTGGIQDPFSTSAMIKQAGAGLTLSHQFTAMTTGDPRGRPVPRLDQELHRGRARLRDPAAELPDCP
jgi:hypothetical protein